MVEITKLVTDYIWCETCKMFVDLWKYGSIEDAGHEGCDWRYVTEAELVECVAACERHGCFHKERIG